MANEYEPEQESDEDCEVYFLKPVNEYNIVDKIKEANKELFANNEANDEKETNELITVESINRKVKFAQNLEEYEPQSGSINRKELEATLGKPISSDENFNEINLKEINESKLEVIKEEELDNVDNSKIEKNEEQLINDMNRKESNDDLKECSSAEELTQPNDVIPEDIILEEICEEILVMDMESTNAEIKSESPGTMQRRILKQITFDYDDEQDNKSLTNLLISDNENDDDQDDEEYNCNESVTEETDNDEKISFANNMNEYYEDNEEDDKLSIIIASYLPDDLASDNNSIISEKSSPHLYRKSRKLPFNKRFSFRRKTKSSNAIAACSVGTNSNKHRIVPPPEVTDLKLHYKTCCEYKNAQQKLPKYTGYLSEYGLSREQLLERERKLQQKHHGLLQDYLKTSEDEMRKMHDNERAFTRWLKNKMRFPINKTRNMFDVKRPFGLRKYTSVGGGISLDNEESTILTNTTKYRSISAKIRKS